MYLLLHVVVNLFFCGKTYLHVGCEKNGALSYKLFKIVSHGGLVARILPNHCDVKE